MLTLVLTTRGAALSNAVQGEDLRVVLICAVVAIAAPVIATAISIALTRKRQRSEATLHYYTSLQHRHWTTLRSIDKRWPGARSI